MKVPLKNVLKKFEQLVRDDETAVGLDTSEAAVARSKLRCYRALLLKQTKDVELDLILLLPDPESGVE